MSIEINGGLKFNPTLDGLADESHSHALGEAIIGDIDGTVGAYRELLSETGGVSGKDLDKCVDDFRARIMEMSHAVSVTESRHGRDGGATIAHKRDMGRRLHPIVSAINAHSSDSNSRAVEDQS